MSAVAHPTRTEFVLAELRQRLMDGRIAGGEPLRQMALAKTLGVSQIPVREALLRLAAEGWVDFIPHRGAVATPLSLAELRELTHLRTLIETDLLRAAIPRLARIHLRRARALLETYDELLSEAREVERWSELNQGFHLALYEAADRPQTLDLVTRLHARSDRYIRIQLLQTDWIPQARSEHRELLEHCTARRTDHAAALLARHIRQAGQALATLLERESAAPAAE